jgi:uncharacterized protein YuzE
MMRIEFDRDHDTLYVRFRELPKTEDSDEVEPGVIVDYGPDGEVVGMEVLDASSRRGWAEWLRWAESYAHAKRSA